MNTTERLLTYDPIGAIVTMVNLENGTNFKPDQLDISAPRAGNVKNTQVTLTARSAKGKTDTEVLIGSIDFEYDRLDLSHHLYGILSGFNPPMPTSTQVLLDEITRRLGQKFVLDDVTLEYIGADNSRAYELKAKAESLRWIGQIVLQVGQVIDLNDLLTPIAPSNLGTFPQALIFASPNVFDPFLNATALQAKVAALPLNTKTQNGSTLVTVLNPLVESPWTPKYREPALDNPFFHQETLGWNATGSYDVLPGIFFYYSYDLTKPLILEQNNPLVLLYQFAGEKSTFFQQIRAQAGQLVEVVLHILDSDYPDRSPLDDPETYRCFTIGHGPSLDQIQHATFLQYSSFEGTSRADIRTLRSIGWVQAFFIATCDHPIVQIQFTEGDGVDPFDGGIALDHFSANVIPKGWLIPNRTAIDTAAVGPYSDWMTLSEETWTLVTSAVDRQLYLTTNFPIGRWALLEFEVVQTPTTGRAALTFRGQNSYEAVTVDLVAGQRYQVLVPYTSADRDTALNSSIVSAGDHQLLDPPLEQHLVIELPAGTGVWKLKSFYITPLPVAFEEDLYNSPEFIDSRQPWSIDKNTDFVDFKYDDYNRIVLNRLGYSSDRVALLSKGLAWNEQARMQVRIGQAYDFEDDNSIGHSSSFYYTQNGGTYGAIKSIELLDPDTPSVNPVWPSTKVMTAPEEKVIVSEFKSPSPITNLATAFDAASPYPSLVYVEKVSGKIIHAPWRVNALPEAFNAYNGAYTQSGAPIQTPNLPISQLTHAFKIQLDPAFSSNLSDGLVELPYRPIETIPSPFMPVSRLTRFGLSTYDDATYLLPGIRGLTQGQVITPALLPAVLDVNLIDSDTPWVVESTTPSLKNLNGAVVTYHGPLRTNDEAAAVLGLNRIVTFSLDGQYNTGFSGTVALYYRDYLDLIPKLPDAPLGEPYQQVLATPGAIAPLTYALRSGNLAPGHTFNATTGTVEGTSTATGSYRPVFEVTDARGYTVSAMVYYTVNIWPLVYTDQTYALTEGQTIGFEHPAHYGQAPYQYRLNSGDLPSFVTLNQNTGKLSFNNAPLGESTFYLEVIDARGMRAISKVSVSVTP